MRPFLMQNMLCKHIFSKNLLINSHYPQLGLVKLIDGAKLANSE